jgi:hypothetical protein
MIDSTHGEKKQAAEPPALPPPRVGKARERDSAAAGSPEARPRASFEA